MLFPVFWIVIEYIRLESARIGNLDERVSKLAASVLLSIFPQIPIMIYIGYFQEIVFPVDLEFSWIMLSLVSLELFNSISVLRNLIRVKTISFYRSCRDQIIDSKKIQIEQESDAAYWSKRILEERENDS